MFRRVAQRVENSIASPAGPIDLPLPSPSAAEGAGVAHVTPPKIRVELRFGLPIAPAMHEA